MYRTNSSCGGSQVLTMGYNFVQKHVYDAGGMQPLLLSQLPCDSALGSFTSKLKFQQLGLFSVI